MQHFIRVFCFSFICLYLHANEDSFSDDFKEIEQKGQEQDIVDQDISQMEITLSAEFEPLSVVAGCVNASTGYFFLADHDFHGDTIDPIELTRLYDDKNFYETFLGFKFGCQYPLLATPTQDSARHSHALIEERNGFFIPYQGKSERHFCLLLYQGAQEIGSLFNGQIQELRLVHPETSHESTFAIEINQKTYFPIQDERHNVAALRDMDGRLAQYSRFSPFGEELVFGETSFANPWRFANRRQVQGLSLFSKRFYNPQLMRWQTPDPLGFEDGLITGSI